MTQEDSSPRRNDSYSFGQTAVGLSQNPLGIIALFIVLVYGLAAVVVGFGGGGLSPEERAPLIYFLVCFPILVLCVFAWLVSKHSGRLFAPWQYRDENNYLKMMQISAAASLSAASAKQGANSSEDEIRKIVELVSEIKPAARKSDKTWRNHLLWVDDRPDNNIYERRAFEAIGLRFSLAETTQQALDFLTKNKVAAIISDMGRREGPREGYVLLDNLRGSGDQTPLFFYAASRDPAHIRETIEHGGQGCTNNPQELFQMVTKRVIEETSE